jgi:hypothetical protein
MTVPPSRAALSVVLAVSAGLLAGCGGGGGRADSGSRTAPVAPEAIADAPPPDLEPPPCPSDAENCERASGQIAYVERVDPDGDGDAHFVLISDESITGPGISVIDVGAGLRPDPLPRPGDLLAASGPVYEGSYGQRQIEAGAIRSRRVARP